MHQFCSCTLVSEDYCYSVQEGKKQRQGVLSECGVTGPTQPRLTDRVRGRQARLRQKELDAEKNKAKEKDKKQEKVDKDKRARDREAAKLRNSLTFFPAVPIPSSFLLCSPDSPTPL
jgi:transposase